MCLTPLMSCLGRATWIWRDIRNRRNSSKSEPHKTKLTSEELRKKADISEIDLAPVRVQSPLLWILGSSRTVWFSSACGT